MNFTDEKMNLPTVLGEAVAALDATLRTELVTVALENAGKSKWAALIRDRARALRQALAEARFSCALAEQSGAKATP